MASFQKKGMQTNYKALAPFEKQNEIPDAMVHVIVDVYLQISWPVKVCLQKRQSEQKSSKKVHLFF